MGNGGAGCYGCYGHGTHSTVRVVVKRESKSHGQAQFDGTAFRQFAGFRRPTGQVSSGMRWALAPNCQPSLEKRRARRTQNCQACRSAYGSTCAAKSEATASSSGHWGRRAYCISS
jgi:hypothetical protein